MSNPHGIIKLAVSDNSMDNISTVNGTAVSGATGVKNNKIDANTFKHPLTSTISTLKVPLKQCREMGRKLSHINAGTYS